MPADEILAAVQDRRFLLQDFVPLSESLDWTLAHLYWQQAGAAAFLSDRVPTRVVSDGNLSAGAAEVFFTSLLAAEGRGELEGTIEVLEVGVGSGLFARYFLDEFRSICQDYKKNYYDRLVYLASDASRKMLDDIAARGVLAAHEGRYRLQVADACGRFLGLDSGLRFRWITFNYVLDVLPATVLRLDGEELREMRLATSFARDVAIIDPSLPDPEEIRRIIDSNDRAQMAKLVSLYPYLSLNHRFEPIDPASLPHSYSLLASTPPGQHLVVHNYGAAACLEQALFLLHPLGCIQIADYTPPENKDTIDLLYRHEHYAGSTAMGLNFRMLAHLAESANLQWLEPEGANGLIEIRLLAHSVAPPVAECFRRRFGAGAFEWRMEHLRKARKLAGEGSYEAALCSYREALARQPRNWWLLEEIGRFLLDTLQDADAALALADEGISINPIQPGLHLLRADALLARERTVDGEIAARQALDLDPKNVDAYYSLVRALRLMNQCSEALAKVAEALALEGGKHRRDVLQAEQQAIVALLTWRASRRDRLLSGRYG